MRFVLTIDSENEGVENREDVAQLVANVARKFSTGRDNGIIHDINGNRVGSYKYDE